MQDERTGPLDRIGKNIQHPLWDIEEWAIDAPFLAVNYMRQGMGFRTRGQEHKRGKSRIGCVTRMGRIYWHRRAGGGDGNPRCQVQRGKRIVLQIGKTDLEDGGGKDINNLHTSWKNTRGQKSGPCCKISTRDRNVTNIIQT